MDKGLKDTKWKRRNLILLHKALKINFLDLKWFWKKIN